MVLLTVHQFDTFFCYHDPHHPRLHAELWSCQCVLFCQWSGCCSVSYSVSWTVAVSAFVTTSSPASSAVLNMFSSCGLLFTRTFRFFKIYQQLPPQRPAQFSIRFQVLADCSLGPSDFLKSTNNSFPPKLLVHFP